MSSTVLCKLDPKDNFQDVGGLERPSSPEPYIYTSNDDAEHDFYAWSDACYSSGSSQSGNSNTFERAYEEDPVPIRPAESNFERRILKAIASVHDTLRQLAELSILIRKFSLKSRHQYVDQSFQPEAYKDLESHLHALLWIQQTHREKVLNFAEKETTDLRHATKHNATTTSLGIIQQRLVKANLKRYHRLICARKRSRAPVRKPSVLHLPNVPDPPTFDSGNNRNDERIESIPNVEENEQWGPAKSQGTGAASKIATEMPALADIQTRAPSRALTRISAGSKLEYPPLPKPSKSEKNFKLDQCYCRFCDQVLTDDYSRNEILWRQHIKEDLYPYICIFDPCFTPDSLYLTSNEWLQHINAEHVKSRWVCSICSTQTAAHEFLSSFEFDAHCLSAHRDIVDPGQLLSLKESCQVPLPISITCCPLCSWPPDSSGAAIDKLQQKLFDHVAKGLHNFALRALPSEFGGSEDENTIAATNDNSQIGRNSDEDSANLNLSRQGTDDSEAKRASEYEIFRTFDSERDIAPEPGTTVSSFRLAMLQEQPATPTRDIEIWLSGHKEKSGTTDPMTRLAIPDEWYKISQNFDSSSLGAVNPSSPRFLDDLPLDNEFFQLHTDWNGYREVYTEEAAQRPSPLATLVPQQTPSPQIGESITPTLNPWVAQNQGSNLQYNAASGVVTFQQPPGPTYATHVERQKFLDTGQPIDKSVALEAVTPSAKSESGSWAIVPSYTNSYAVSHGSPHSHGSPESHPPSPSQEEAEVNTQSDLGPLIISLCERSRDQDFTKRPKYSEVCDTLENLAESNSKPSDTLYLKKEQKRHEDWMRKGKKLFGKANAPLHILKTHMQYVLERNIDCFDINSDKPRVPAEPASREPSPAEDKVHSWDDPRFREVFCICRRVETGMMIECDLCHEWYHGKCLKIARGRFKDNEKYACPICDWRIKIPRDAARLALKDLQFWQDEIPGLPFQPDEEDILNKIIENAQEFRSLVSPYCNPVMTSAGEVETQRFYLRKIEGAEILLPFETNFFRQELHRWSPVAPEPPPVLEASESTRKPRPTKLQKLLAQHDGVINPNTLPQGVKIKPHTFKRKSIEPYSGHRQPLQPAPSRQDGHFSMSPRESSREAFAPHAFLHGEGMQSPRFSSPVSPSQNASPIFTHRGFGGIDNVALGGVASPGFSGSQPLGGVLGGSQDVTQMFDDLTNGDGMALDDSQETSRRARRPEHKGQTVGFPYQERSSRSSSRALKARAGP